jgi:hypothetical protein
MLELRDFLDSRDKEHCVILHWERGPKEDAFKDPAIMLGLLPVQDAALVDAKLRMARMVVRESAELGDKPFAEPSALIETLIKGGSMVAVFDPRMGRYTSLAGLRRDGMTDWSPVVKLDKKLDPALVTTSGTTEELAKKNIAKNFLAAITKDPEWVDAFTAWLKGGQKVERESEAGARPNSTSVDVYLPRQRAVAKAKRDAEKKTEK